MEAMMVGVVTEVLEAPEEGRLTANSVARIDQFVAIVDLTTSVALVAPENLAGAKTWLASVALVAPENLAGAKTWLASVALVAPENLAGAKTWLALVAAKNLAGTMTLLATVPSVALAENLAGLMTSLASVPSAALEAPENLAGERFRRWRSTFLGVFF